MRIYILFFVIVINTHTSLTFVYVCIYACIDRCICIRARALSHLIQLTSVRNHLRVLAESRYDSHAVDELSRARGDSARAC